MNVISNFNKHVIVASLIVLISFVSSTTLYAQIPVSVMVGEKQTQHEFFFFKSFDKKQKVNIFTMGQFNVDHQQAAFNTSSINTQISYNLTPIFGISAGASMANQELRPLVAVSLAYANQKGDLLINLFPGMVIKDQPEYELMGLILYQPKISKNFNLIFQAFVGSTYNKKIDQHLFSFNQVKLGVGYKDWFQVGVGMNQNFLGDDFQKFDNFGIFLRKQF